MMEVAPAMSTSNYSTFRRVAAAAATVLTTHRPTQAHANSSALDHHLQQQQQQTQSLASTNILISEDSVTVIKSPCRQYFSQQQQQQQPEYLPPPCAALLSTTPEEDEAEENDRLGRSNRVPPLPQLLSLAQSSTKCNSARLSAAMIAQPPSSSSSHMLLCFSPPTLPPNTNNCNNNMTSLSSSSTSSSSSSGFGGSGSANLPNSATCQQPQTTDDTSSSASSSSSSGVVGAASTSPAATVTSVQTAYPPPFSIRSSTFLCGGSAPATVMPPPRQSLATVDENTVSSHQNDDQQQQQQQQQGLQKQMLTPLQQHELSQVDIFYRSLKTDVRAAKGMAQLLAFDPSTNEEKHMACGIPLFLVDKLPAFTSQKKQKRKSLGANSGNNGGAVLYFIIAERGTGFTLHRERIRQSDAYCGDCGGDHRLSAVGPDGRRIWYIVRFAESNNAADFLNVYDNDLAKTLFPNQSNGKSNPASAIMAWWKGKLPSKLSLSKPCCSTFRHLTTLDASYLQRQATEQQVDMTSSVIMRHGNSRSYHQEAQMMLPRRASAPSPLVELANAVPNQPSAFVGRYEQQKPPQQYRSSAIISLPTKSMSTSINLGKSSTSIGIGLVTATTPRLSVSSSSSGGIDPRPIVLAGY